MKSTLSSHFYVLYTLLAVGFCERWPKAWRVGFAPVREQLLIVAKNLPLTDAATGCCDFENQIVQR